VASSRSDLYIGGKFRPAHAKAVVTMTNPTTEEVIGTAPAGDAQDVDAAVKAARAALPAWRELAPKDRATYLDAVAEGYESRSAEFRNLITEENGSPGWWTEFTDAAGTYRLGAAMAREFEVEVQTEMFGLRGIVRREPVGVVGAIVPWNAPQALLALKVATALAAGCTLVAKPSPETSLDSYILAEVFQAAGVPDGVMNIVTGGADTGEGLVRHDGVDKISFTGSTAAGRKIGAICGERLCPMTAELGGKSAAILLDDADLELFASAVNRECIPYSGQVCYSATRILAPRRQISEVRDLIVETLRTTPLGDPTDPATVIGPIVTPRQRERVQSYIRSGVEDGATVELGGEGTPGIERGYFVRPTVFTNVNPSMKIFQEEIFGPVVVLVPYEEEAEAVSLANATQYGLSGIVFSRDSERATELARLLETGRVLLNGNWGPPDPFTGYKNSGVGGGFDRITDYVNSKSISQP
jgi:acyl-CoA reductase-like NAD-dependent aldehyde dehydrogenase